MMKAMILAAGRGERMRPLTDHSPKPLLKVAEIPLVVWHIKRLAKAGFQEIVINHAWLGEQIEQTLGDGSEWGVSIQYSPERQGGLETAGGIATALPLLGDQPFLVVNGDTYSDIDFAGLRVQAEKSEEEQLAYLVLIERPEYRAEGDFILFEAGKVYDRSPETQDNALTFSGIGVYHPKLFADIKPNEVAKLAPLLRETMANNLVFGEKHSGLWLDVGTVERLALANEIAKTRNVL